MPIEVWLLPCTALMFNWTTFPCISFSFYRATRFSKNSMESIFYVYSNVVKNFLEDSFFCCFQSWFRLVEVDKKFQYMLYVTNQKVESSVCFKQDDLAGPPFGPYLLVHEFGTISSRRDRTVCFTFGGAQLCWKLLFWNFWASDRTWVSSTW